MNVAESAYGRTCPARSALFHASADDFKAGGMAALASFTTAAGLFAAERHAQIPHTSKAETTPAAQLRGNPGPIVDDLVKKFRKSRAAGPMGARRQEPEMMWPNRFPPKQET